MAGKNKKVSPRASAWEKISARGAEESLAHREVHDRQQLDRGKIEEVQTKTFSYIVAGIVGVLVFIVAWVMYSLVAFSVVGFGQMIDTFGSSGLGSASSSQSEDPYWAEITEPGADGSISTCYKQRSETAIPTGECYPSPADVPVPDWYEGPTYAEQQVQRDPVQQQADQEAPGHDDNTVGTQLVTITGMKLLLTVGVAAAAGLALGTWSSKRIDAENLMRDTSDINQHENDQHIALPEEILRKFDVFPDVGAHSGVQVSSMISHVMLSQKGLKDVSLTQRAKKDIVDPDGEIVYYAGEEMTDDEGVILTQNVPIIDESFGDALFEASGLPDSKKLRKRFDVTTVPYNPPTPESRREAKKMKDPRKLKGGDRDKLGIFESISDLINEDWELPAYEVQRPAGAYVVDTAPVNTMVLAITRAGKGQTIIEPTLDMWSREKRPSNMLVNDPKGELLVKFYERLVMRGYEVVQFNLINAMKTDIYNPLGLAAEAAREGDTTKTAMYIENIGEVFFSAEGGDDPVWPNSANNAFKRICYGMIDYYLEAEYEIRQKAAEVGMDPEVLEQKLDDLWGHVTLFNCYQMFVQLSSKNVKNPEAELERRIKAGEFDDNEKAFDAEAEKVKAQAVLWGGKSELDMLSLYFNATDLLPRNGIRGLVSDAHNSLRSMAGAEKMLASVYGIAITGMSFFTDPTISTLTSGKPSQNTDLGGLSFPRRFGVRFTQNFMKENNLVGLQGLWRAFADPMFTESLGKDFEHDDLVTREGWARYYFKGIFPKDRAWLRLQLRNPETNMLVRTFYFEFKKSYQVSLSGRHYITEPVTGEKQVKNGVLRELRPVREGDAFDGKVMEYRYGSTTYVQSRLDLTTSGKPEEVRDQTPAIMQTMVRYSEKPKAVFVITPPHLMKYAKLILILIKQLVDLNFDKSYMTKSNQKPLYKTRFMIDELGNLQSEGKGISGFETMLSIGLGQEQQFHLILQTLQQLRDVYGESVDKIVQGNTSNIIFLKSTDESMIETLEKMSGTTHKAYVESKQVSRDVKKLAMKNEGAVSYTMSTKEEPLIKFNDMQFIARNNSIVFRAGDAPVWNRNETILPMSWRLFKDTIHHPGHEYSLQTIPTLSSAIEFDVRQNIPNFRQMVDKRMREAVQADSAKELYQESYGYEDLDIERLDPDLHAQEVMDIVRMLVNMAEGRDPHAAVVDSDEVMDSMIDEDQVTDNVVQVEEMRAREKDRQERERLIYAQGTISRSMLITETGVARNPGLDVQFAEAYRRALRDLARDAQHFQVTDDGQLRSADGHTAYITPAHSAQYTKARDMLNEAVGNASARVFAEGEVNEEDAQNVIMPTVHPEFYQFLAALPTWEHLAGGAWERDVAREMNMT